MSHGSDSEDEKNIEPAILILTGLITAAIAIMIYRKVRAKSDR